MSLYNARRNPVPAQVRQRNQLFQLIELQIIAWKRWVVKLIELIFYNVIHYQCSSGQSLDDLIKFSFIIDEFHKQTGSKNSVVKKPSGPPPPGLEGCKICGRFFAPDRIAKHESICKKTTTKKRKVFDPTKMRMVGTDAEPYLRKVSASKNKKEPPKVIFPFLISLLVSTLFC